VSIRAAELKQALAGLWLNDRHLIIHASLRALGQIDGGAEALLEIMLASARGLMMPTFTYRTMVIPEEGPAGNGITYGSGGDQNQMAEMFEPQMPADKLMGALAETLRQHPEAARTQHPILSFAGIRCEEALRRQTLEQPLGPIEALWEEDGSAVLIGVDYSVNTSIHLGEQRAGRLQFVRWSLTKSGIVECPAFPGDSRGFRVLEAELRPATRVAQGGRAQVTAVPGRNLVAAVETRLAVDPLALLCEHSDCERCNAVRAAETGANQFVIT
jgi:aminoglycoside 3-N-acetyltransferase